MPPRIDRSAVENLRKTFAGALVEPGSADYDQARTIYNAMIDRRPALIARCADRHDVVHAVNFGRDNGLEIAVRGGGHGAPNATSIQQRWPF